MLTYGSLFSGIGGLDLGFDRAGMQCKWQVEIDDYARRVLAKHWPHVRRHDDVRTFPPTDPDEWRVDVIAGGFPCKQTSTGAAIHGKRIGLDGHESGLWFQMLHVVRLLKPQWVVVENVSGAIQWNETIKRGLADLGYRVPHIPLKVSAESLGAPHSRWRVFWIADFDGKGLEITWQGGPSKIETRERRAIAGNSWLECIAEPWGVVDGVPNRVDRIRCLGNAVVPAVAEWIARRIVAAAGRE